MTGQLMQLQQLSNCVCMDAQEEKSALRVLYNDVEMLIELVAIAREMGAGRINSVWVTRLSNDVARNVILAARANDLLGIGQQKRTEFIHQRETDDVAEDSVNAMPEFVSESWFVWMIGQVGKQLRLLFGKKRRCHMQTSNFATDGPGSTVRRVRHDGVLLRLEFGQPRAALPVQGNTSNRQNGYADADYNPWRLLEYTHLTSLELIWGLWL